MSENQQKACLESITCGETSKACIWTLPLRLHRSMRSVDSDKVLDALQHAKQGAKVTTENVFTQAMYACLEPELLCAEKNLEANRLASSEPEGRSLHGRILSE